MKTPQKMDETRIYSRMSDEECRKIAATALRYGWLKPGSGKAENWTEPENPKFGSSRSASDRRNQRSVVGTDGGRSVEASRGT